MEQKVETKVDQSEAHGGHHLAVENAAEKVMIIARLSPPAIDGELKMGSKTILILRENAMIRTPYSSSGSSSSDSSSLDRKKRSESSKDKAKPRKRRKHKKRKKKRMKKKVDQEPPPRLGEGASLESLVKLTEIKSVEPVEQSPRLVDATTSPILIKDDNIIDDNTVREKNQSRSTSLRESGCNTDQSLCAPHCDKTQRKKKSKAGCSKNCPGRKRKESKIVMPSLSSRGCAKSCSRYKIIVCQPGTSADDDDTLEMRARVSRFSDKVQTKARTSIRKIKSLYKSIDVKRAQGFKCNLNKCDNTLLECSMGPCRNKSMLFNRATIGIEEIEPHPTESTPATVTETVQDAASQTSDNSVKTHCSAYIEYKDEKKRSKFNPFKKQKKKNIGHDSREKLRDKRASREDLVTSSVGCKNHQICQCPTNPGMYSAKEGHALCCCPDESCVSAKRRRKK